MSDAQQFYDELVDYYDLIFADWEASMSRQGEALDKLLRARLPARAPGTSLLRVLDVACGIGTQSLPLAARGYQVTSRDISPAAVARLQREAQTRQVSLDAAVADMRQVSQTTSGSFDAVLVFDNSLPHLLSDQDLLQAFQEFWRLTVPGGWCLCSVRDYDRVERGAPFVHAYGVRRRGGVRYLCSFRV